MSLRLSASRPFACSGAMYAAVPRITPTPVIIAGDVIVGDCRDVGAARSCFRVRELRQAEVEHLHRAVGRTLIFAGFRSRWMMPCSCAASRASAICRAIGSASSSGIGPRAMRSARVVALDQLHDERVHASRYPRGRRSRRCADGSARRAPALRA